MIASETNVYIPKGGAVLGTLSRSPNPKIQHLLQIIGQKDTYYTYTAGDLSPEFIRKVKDHVAIIIQQQVQLDIGFLIYLSLRSRALSSLLQIWAKSLGLQIGKEFVFSGTQNIICPKVGEQNTLSMMTKTRQGLFLAQRHKPLCSCLQEFPWKERVNELIRRCHSGGIINQIVAKNSIRSNKERIEAKKEDLIVLNLTHLLNPFLVLAAGIVISCSLFVFESTISGL